MSILIKGLNKPKTCDDCIVPSSKCDFLMKRSNNCPLIEVPDGHGRLIDIDMLHPDHFVSSTSTNAPIYLYISKEQIDNAPTIIPADRKE